MTPSSSEKNQLSFRQLFTLQEHSITVVQQLVSGTRPTCLSAKGIGPRTALIYFLFEDGSEGRLGAGL